MAMTLDSEKIQQAFGIDDQGFKSLVRAGLVFHTPQRPVPRHRIDYVALQQKYQLLMVEGPFLTKAHLAR